MKLQLQLYLWLFWLFSQFLAIVQQEISPRCLQTWAVKALKQIWGIGLVSKATCVKVINRRIKRRVWWVIFTISGVDPLNVSQISFRILLGFWISSPKFAYHGASLHLTHMDKNYTSGYAWFKWCLQPTFPQTGPTCLEMNRKWLCSKFRGQRKVSVLRYGAVCLPVTDYLVYCRRMGEFSNCSLSWAYMFKLDELGLSDSPNHKHASISLVVNIWILS